MFLLNYRQIRHPTSFFIAKSHVQIWTTESIEIAALFTNIRIFKHHSARAILDVCTISGIIVHLEEQLELVVELQPKGFG